MLSLWHPLTLCPVLYLHLFFFFFNDTATTEIYTLSLHDALPICHRGGRAGHGARRPGGPGGVPGGGGVGDVIDRKSTRLNSSHGYISYAVFCLKKKKIRFTLALCDVAVVVHTSK